MGWQDLRALRAAVRHGSITAAAAVLDRTRPALSRRIARLERQLGTPLLVRTPRSCVPTDAGRLLVDSAAHPGLGHLVGPGGADARRRLRGGASVGRAPRAVQTQPHVHSG
ncbi:helix-turn-helix domain-containing protein [Micromonospora sp. AKA38]|uniref:helix-turn-helix domain-containing protein n=1 Tax=Micromonospora sp. AKA38 TaxID=2733861 RepID=UPI0022BB7FD5|nr:LysR family transcriptional regulator [Micromonospora sp. AKA38]GHJ16094.1 hypothetical protein TPA0908_40890 [Micromonospora sp. AKA38]